MEQLKQKKERFWRHKTSIILKKSEQNKFSERVSESMCYQEREREREREKGV